MATLASLRDAGVLRHIGLSNVTVAQFETAQQIVEIAAVTAQYNVGVRDGADLLEAAERSGVVFSPWHPAAIPGGADSGPSRAVLEPLHDALGARAANLARVAPEALVFDGRIEYGPYQPVALGHDAPATACCEQVGVPAPYTRRRDARQWHGAPRGQDVVAEQLPVQLLGPR